MMSLTTSLAEDLFVAAMAFIICDPMAFSQVGQESYFLSDCTLTEHAIAFQS